MKKSLSLLLFTLLLLEGNFLPAQVTFNKVSFPFGSFSGLVGGITQDNNGYVWLATQYSGLYRYDGYRFKAYIHDPSNKNSLFINILETVYADRKGIIWIATYIDGIDRFDPATGIFTHFGHNSRDPESLSSDTVRSLLEDREGTLWIGTNRGLDRFDPKTNTFHTYRYNPKDSFSLSCDQVRKIYEDKQGTLWIGTGSIWEGEGGETEAGGLNRFDKKTGKFTRFLHKPSDPHSLINNKIQAICEDSRGNFWVGTAGDGLHTMDREKGTFERHLYDPHHPDKLSRPPLKEGFFTDHITFISEDALGGIWIGTISNGLNRYDPKTQKTVHYGIKDGAVGFSDNSGWSFCNTKDGVLWIGTWEGGLYRIDPYHRNVPHVAVNGGVSSFTEDAEGNLWMGTRQDLLVKNRKTGRFKTFVHEASDPNSLNNNINRALFRDRQGT
ncbi:MAG: hypothetical protein ICV79_13975, partial [Flavisolibacter sp.]|nr:hypothetical protein [Flavisolibacter sp.]